MDVATLTTAEVPADLMRTVAANCPACFKATYAPTPEGDLDGLVRKLSILYRLQGDALMVAAAYGYHGTTNDLQYAAHREMYAQGDDTQLACMLRHVRVGDDHG